MRGAHSHKPSALQHAITVFTVFVMVFGPTPVPVIAEVTSDETLDQIVTDPQDATVTAQGSTQGINDPASDSTDIPETESAADGTVPENAAVTHDETSDAAPTSSEGTDEPNTSKTNDQTDLAIQDDSNETELATGAEETTEEPNEEARTYTVVFEANGGTGSMNPLVDCVYDEPHQLPTCKFQRVGYSFVGWNDQADGGGKAYADEEKLIIASPEPQEIEPEDSLTLYAQWTANVYQITYELDGGTNDPANPLTYTSESETTTLATPKKTGYTFDGWYADASYRNAVTSIRKGSVGDIVLYARWHANSYSIRYAGNGSTSGQMATVTGCYYGTSYELTANAFKRTGYTFKSWNTKADGSGRTYANHASIKNLTSKDGATVTLYAQWAPYSYAITYVLKGGKNSSSNPKSYTIKSATINLANPKRSGYKFEGWYTSSSYRTKVTSIPKGSTGKKTFYAKWSILTYRLTYILNGGTNNSSNPSTYKVTNATITLAKPTRRGYTFGGWYSDATYKTRISSIAKGSTGSKKLYAKWTPTKYTITYNLNGGTNSKKNPATYTITSTTVTLMNPTRTGYSFMGWYTSSSYKTRVTSIPKGSTGKKTLYAKWKAHSYSIVFNGNGATSGSMSRQSNLSYGTSHTLAANTFSRSGYTFKGWNTKANGTGASYSNRSVVKNLTSTQNGVVTLYAQWESLVSWTLSDTSYGGVAIIKNNNPYNIKLTATFLYYNGSTLVDTQKEYAYCLERGRTCALQGWIYKVNYTSVRLQVSWERASNSIVGNASRISCSSNFGSNNVMVSVRNNGVSAEFTQVAVVFYKGGKVVGYDYQYADVDNPGSTDYLDFRFPHTRDYDTIVPDSYKVYVNESYRYDWSR